MDRRTFLATGVATAAFGAEALAQHADHLPPLQDAPPSPAPYSQE